MNINQNDEEFYRVRSSLLPYGRQWIDEQDCQAVEKVLNSEFLTTGPMVGKFEAAVAQYTGAKYAVAFSSGTAALHAACFAAGIEEGDEVITTPMTFAATANCILYQKACPVFADIDPDTYNISPASISSLITSKTKAIIPVHFTGQPANMKAIHKIAQEHNLVVIEDAAHALGAFYNGKAVGGLNDMTMFSFHPVKHITTGEGGMITTNNPQYRDSLLKFRTHGISRNPQDLVENHGPWYYEMEFLGFNYRMTDIQAALGESQLTKLSGFIQRRKKYVQMYNEAFKDLKELTIPFQDQLSDSSWHLYVIRLNLDQLKVGRKKIFESFLKANIGVNVHYIPVYYHPFYKKLGFQKGLCPAAEKLYEEIITLPLHPSMTKQDAEDVISVTKSILSHYSVHS
ncbi:UDP-4-amino-4,6-dideoxy-N-acetyl-beta-L-altrosamine transaminase [Halobacillus rhizosphaerae]|uniref:UDP-4-amino-4, 6-dideoxy-N-acetyl-beta-L-altrosamine transaminase n=1 Tax=Halobacillus rhizosphaerae TaxID=3064889 RepID=UPI00398ADBB7